MATSGADVLVQHLRKNNVDTVFAITGAGNLAIIDAIVRDGNIKLIYSHHEQAVVMEAQGYSRISGKIGVALVTTGGGTSNVVTGVLSAHLDSIPVLIISGNESSFHCNNSQNLRAYGVQGFDSVSVLKPVTKFSKRITTSNEVSELIQEALVIATSGRNGPSHLDFPMDIQRQICEPGDIKITTQPKITSTLNVDRISADLDASTRPLFYFGNGCRNDIELILEFLEKFRLPYAVSWSALDLFNHQDPLNVGTIGIYGSHSGNIILQKSDLLICVGTRLAIPQIGYNKQDFGRNAKKVVVDIDPSELEKFENLGWDLVSSEASDFIRALLEGTQQNKSISNWEKEIASIKEELPLIDHIGPSPSPGYVHSAQILQALPALLAEDAIIVTDVGAPLLNGHYIVKPKLRQRLFTSQGLGEMGFGLPGAIGAHFADPTRQIVCLNTDGAIMFNLQELQVVRHHQIPLKLFIFNNGGYGMIKISQENLFDSRLSGSDTSHGISFPSFEAIADAFGFTYSSVNNLEDLLKLSQVLHDSTPLLVDVKMDPTQKYFPRLATNKLPDGSFVSPPLEDLTPFIPIELLEKLLGYAPMKASYEVRGLQSNENK
jgi:acetolactate synthase-1/2/3 large subunit